MNYLIAFILLSFSSLTLSEGNPFVTNDTSSYHVITQDNCLMLQAIGKAAVSAKQQGVVEVTVLSSLMKPQYFQEVSFRALLPDTTIMVNKIYTNNNDTEIVTGSYHECEASIGKSVLYYN
jgi:hypothetical protein